MPKHRLPLFKLLKSPKLKVYQQIIICFIVVVLIPLLGVSFIIYSINQTALKKELTKFTEHTADGIYKEFRNEMNWQQAQSALLGNFLLARSSGEAFGSSAKKIFQWAPDLEAVAIYDQHLNLIHDAYRHFSHVSPELRLPLTLNKEDLREPYQVLYSHANDPQYATYFLRALVPVSSPGPVAYYVMQKRFDFLQRLIRANMQTLYDGVYVIDNKGMIIAGPSSSVDETHYISPEDFRFFKKLKAGVSREFASNQPTVDISPLINGSFGDQDNDKDDQPSLQKVFIKMPNINWGLIIESPYHVRQKFVKRARTQSLLLIVACLLIVVVLGLFYILSISRNFRQLIKGIKAMAEGNYSRRIRLITNTTTPYEIIYLAGEFNRMGRKMADAWHESQQLNRELRDANDKLAKIDEMKSNLIDTVSHELRTPLTSIKGYSSRLIRYDKTLDPETRIKNLKVIKQQADRLTRLVDDLLVIPDLENQSLRVFPDQVILFSLLEESVSFIQHKEHREIDVSVPETDLKVLADPDRLGQILLNLLDNAVKYSLPETVIRVYVYTLPSEEEKTEVSNPMIHLQVVNESEPIPAAVLETLFEKFKRMDESTTRTTRGSGLGLFITKGLVEAMGGNIHLDFQDNRFIAHIQLPAYIEPALTPV